MIAGVRVPPKPQEPDNCCMSGCVNCVWDTFRDDMEEWASQSAKAEKALQAQMAQGRVDVLGAVDVVKRTKSPSVRDINPAMTMDDDGGGSETNWPVDKLEKPKISKNLWNEDLYKNIPVGIREFMKTEKKLKERHELEGPVGG